MRYQLLMALLILSTGFAHGQTSVFPLQAEQIASGDKVELSGQWWFRFGAHLSPNQVLTGIETDNLGLVPAPAGWHQFLDTDANNPNLNGIATYATRITFDSPPKVPISLLMPYVNDGYRVIWMPFDQPDNAVEIGQSGDWQTGKFSAREDMLYSLPTTTDALLIIYLAKAQSFFGGIQEPIAIQSQRAAQDNRDLVNILRALMMGAILVMCIHYSIQYFHWRGNLSSLLLAIICMVTFTRSMAVSGATDLLLSYITDNHFAIRLRLEYSTILIGPAAFLHFNQSLIPNIYPKRLMFYLWVYALTFSLLTIVIPFELMTKYLIAYQITLFLLSFVCLGSLIKPAWDNKPFARLILAASGIFAIGVINDVYASISANYHFYIIEFCMFSYLFFQAQIVGIKLNQTVNLSQKLNLEKEKLEQEHDKAVLDSQLDHLTGLYNRKAFDNLLNLTWQHAHLNKERTSIILIDLDHFKDINDKHGHIIGDEVLIYIASLLRSQNMRKGDFISRYGGEEFIIILPNTSLEDAYKIAEKLRVAIERTPAYEDKLINVNITGSFGVYTTIPTHDDYREALTKADQALYLAKEKGRNRVISAQD